MQNGCGVYHELQVGVERETDDVTHTHTHIGKHTVRAKHNKTHYMGTSHLSSSPRLTHHESDL